MSLSSYNPHERYRQRATQRMMSALLALFFMFCSGVFGVWLGRMNASQEMAALQSAQEESVLQRNDLQEAVTRLRAEVQTAHTRFERLQDSYEETIPEGPMRDLVMLIKEQLDEGMDPVRLELAVRSARPPDNCTDPETRRFVVSTPAYQGPESMISLAEGALSISAAGSSARNDKGQSEAWYDPSRMIDLVFTSADGEQEKKKGTLPLHHSVIVGEREYRFTISEGARSFAKVTFDSCDYP